MTYVDGYLAPVRRDRKDIFVAFSKRTAAIYKEYGALRIVDNWLDETVQGSAGFHAEGARNALDSQSEDARDFRTAAGLQSDEVVVLSWIEWPDKSARDEGLAKALADPRVQPSDDEEAIFDGRRLIAGGFVTIMDM